MRLLFFLLPLLLLAQGPDTAVDESVQLEGQASMARGAAYLLAHQEADGSWSHHPGITSAAVLALESVDATGSHAKAVDHALDYLVSQVQPDGSMRRLAGNDIYSTSICLMALVTAKRPADKPVIARIRAFLVASQLPKGYDYGAYGFRYQTSTYPDLSNTHWALEALNLTEARQPTAANRQKLKLWHAAALLISRCQITGRNAAPDEQGGFTYYPLDQRHVDDRHQQELAASRVWGSLTCGAIKSLLYAGVPRTDPRVQAGRDWLARHFSLTANPGLKTGGLYYYYYMLSTLEVMLGDETIALPGRAPLVWRTALAEQLLSRQSGNGSWVNDSALWMEDNPNLATAYAILAMGMALKT